VINSNPRLSILQSGSFTTMTIRSGGLMMLGVVPTQGTTSTIDVQANLNFGLGGAAEAVIYTTGLTGGNNRVVNQISGNITAAGLTKVGSGQLNLAGVNNLSAPVTLNAGVLFVQNVLNGTASPYSGALNGQPLILNGGQLNVDTALGTPTLTTLPDASLTAPRRALATLNSDIYVNADAGIYARDYTNADFGTNNPESRPLQRLKSLTFADLGADSGEEVAEGGVATEGRGADDDGDPWRIEGFLAEFEGAADVADFGGAIEGGADFVVGDGGV
jgi:autotransporter-associated beta strand protein